MTTTQQSELDFSQATITEDVVLPSLGYFYKKEDGDFVFPGGKLQIRSTTAKEEKIMFGRSVSPDKKIDYLLASCCTLNGYDPQDLLVTDRNFLLIKIRSLSFGPEYPISIKCEDCGEQYRKDIDLSTLSVKYYDTDDVIEEPFKVTLPKTGWTLTFRLLRGKDETALGKEKKRAIRKNGDDNSYISEYARRLLSANGKELERLDALRLIENLNSFDLAAFRHAVEDADTGIQTNIEVDCPFCGFVSEIELPFNKEFFRPKRR